MPARSGPVSSCQSQTRRSDHVNAQGGSNFESHCTHCNLSKERAIVYNGPPIRGRRQLPHAGPSSIDGETTAKEGQKDCVVSRAHDTQPARQVCVRWRN